MADNVEQGNEPSRSIKDRTILDRMIDSWLLLKDPSKSIPVTGRGGL
jgi:hypothetical protein